MSTRRHAHLGPLAVLATALGLVMALVRCDGGDAAVPTREVPVVTPVLTEASAPTVGSSANKDAGYIDAASDATSDAPTDAGVDMDAAD